MVGEIVKPGDIIIKDDKVLNGFITKKFHKNLRPIMIWHANSFGLVITESYRKQLHSNDLHGTGPVRAYDARVWCYENDLADKIEAEINALWIYDPRRPNKKVAIIHKNRGAAGQHFHIQVHPNTILRRK